MGISPSYLNLIEHNRRRIGGKLLSDIAKVLDVDPALLAEGADAEMLDQIRAAADLAGARVELAKAEELAARYPGWSGLIAAQARRIAALQAQVQSLTDRMTYDPDLAASLHDMISAVSAIRSAAAILVGPEPPDEDWQRRFHQNIHNDSLRLAAGSEALIAYLEAPSKQPDQPMSPTEDAENWLGAQGFHVAALERGEATPEALVAGSGRDGAAAALLLSHLRQYAEDAALWPMADFAPAAKAAGYDPVVLCRQGQRPFAMVLRRLAALPPGAGHPPIGYAHCDAAGALRVLKSVPGFSLPRYGAACPLWPLYAVLSRPEQPLRLDVVLPDADQTRLLCYAQASLRPATQFDAPPVVESAMVALPDPGGAASNAYPVGISCRICPRQDCSSRREPAMAGIVP